MVRRALLTAAAAVALVALPAAAMAYDAPGYTTTVTDPTPAIGQAFTLTTDGQTAGEQLILTVTSDPASIGNDKIAVAGSRSLAKTADADGAASWSITLSAAGTYTLAVTNAAGQLVGDETVTVAAATGPALSDTGFDGMPLAIGAGALVALGAAAVVVARRRREVTAS